ncbi:MAG: type II secretion system secretin GspD [Gammaproteobacteria bacterium]|nr:type II secretion system secretin GspD [Gammaproteobacteria bacterium]
MAPPPSVPAPPPVNNRSATPSAQPGAQPGAPAGTVPINGNQILLNFQGADIQAVVKAVSQMTGRNFLLDPRVKGQITIISAKPVSRSSAYQIFLSALKAQGFTAVEGSGLVKIIPTGEAKMSADVFKDAPKGGEQITTHVAVLQNVSATQMVPLLRPLMAPTSQLSAYEGANALILTDYADNIRRMLKIIERIDQPTSSDVTVVPVQHASALDLADLIARLAAAPGANIPGQPGMPGGGGGDRFTIIPDLRTNSLLIRTDNPGRLEQLRTLITKLDVPATTGGQTRVIYLRNAEAIKLVEVLRGLLAGEARSQQAAATAVAATPGVGVARPANRTAESSLIQADESTNALIINASDAVYNNLRAVIEKLDVRRAQVLVEALVAEVKNTNSSELGIQWASGGKAGEGAVVGATNYTNGASLFGTVIDPKSSLGSAAGFTLAFLGKKITLADGTEIRSLGALARALETRSLANVLSTPHLMTLDNAEATITVGDNVPFITGSTTSTTGGTTNPFQTVERKDVGIKLKIKPQISEGGGVRMDIAQEISAVTATGRSVGAADLIVSVRKVETKVLVDDGNTVVLGGLLEEKSNDARQEVPLLGRIPLLGALFRSKTTDKTKTNLMVFLRPSIIRTAEDGYRLTTDRYNAIRAQSDKNNNGPAELLDRFEPTRPKPPEEKKPEEKDEKKDDVPNTSSLPKKEQDVPQSTAPSN